MMHTPAATPVGVTASLEGLEVDHRALDERRCVVVVEGELDLASAPTLKSALTRLLGRGYREFVLDLSQLGHMDSTGLGVLIGLQIRLKDDGMLAIAAAPHNVLLLFEVTRLTGRFDLFPSVDEAVAHLHGTRADHGRPPLSPDAAMVIGLASTALPFAEAPTGAAERWLRILRCHGDAARALWAVGLSDAPLATVDHAAAAEPADPEQPSDRAMIATVIEHATGVAERRGAGAVGTTDVLAGVMSAYGADFDRVLSAYGCDRGALTENLGRRPGRTGTPAER
jgi:anti-sigma B factor antagonist